MSSLVGYLFGGERVSIYEMMAIFGGFFGAMLMVNDSIFSGANSVEALRRAKDQQEYHYYYLGMFSAFLCTIFSAFNY